MKIFLVMTLVLALGVSSFGQQTTYSSPAIQADYLKNSKGLQTAAWVFLDGGLLVGMIGAFWSTEFTINGSDSQPFWSDKAHKTGSVAKTVAICSVLTSIPFFIAARHNKKKYASLSFKNNAVPKLQQGSLVSQAIPSLALKIRL